MPIYEYECVGCGHRFERRQSFHEEPIGVCPLCQAKARRLLHSVPILFKGSGFYVTDYGGGSSRAGEVPKPKDEDKPRNEDKPKESPEKE